MYTYLKSLLPKLKDKMQTLDDTVGLVDRSWTSVGNNQSLATYIFRSNHQLIVSENGMVTKGSWEFLKPGDILIDLADKSYLFEEVLVKNGLLALQLKDTERFALFFDKKHIQNKIESSEEFIELIESASSSHSRSEDFIQESGTTTKGYKVLSENDAWDIFWGKHVRMLVEIIDQKRTVDIFQGNDSSRFFTSDIGGGRKYHGSLDEAVEFARSYL